MRPVESRFFHYADKSRITFHEVAERVLLGEFDSTTFHSDDSTIDAFWDTNTGALHNNIAYHHGTTAERWSRIQTFHCEVAVLGNPLKRKTPENGVCRYAIFFDFSFVIFPFQP